MCGRFALDSKVNDLITEFVGAGGEYNEWVPSWNIAPTDPIVVLAETIKDDERTRRVETARWGLTPSWSTELKTKFPTFNARAEEVASKATYQSAMKSHRAIVPASGFYEWKPAAEGQKYKRPHYIHLPDGALLGLAGLYSWWKDPVTGEWHLTTTILTADAVDEIVGIHDRSPVPLPADMWDWWVDPTIVGDQAMADAAVQAALPIAHRLEVHEVAPITSATVDGPELIRSIDSGRS